LCRLQRIVPGQASVLERPHHGLYESNGRERDPVQK
jgi:hypothetical protein